jgi:hypothetical protein
VIEVPTSKGTASPIYTNNTKKPFENEADKSYEFDASQTHCYMCKKDAEPNALLCLECQVLNKRKVNVNRFSILTI